MRKLSNETSPKALSPAPSEAQVDAASEPMARNVLENASQYLEGARPDFTAQFLLSDLAHNAAANKFALWLRELGFGEPVPLTEWRDTVDETRNNIRYDRFVSVARAAQLNERNIVVEITAFKGPDHDEATPYMVRYMSGTEMVYNATTEVDQA